FGFPCPEPIDGVDVAPDAATAMRGARYALLPIPGIAADGSLFAPSTPVPIVPDESLLRELEPGAHVILGAADEKLRAGAAGTGVMRHEYEDDVELMLLGGPAIVEGALQQAIANTRVTIHNADVVVVGHGTIGALLVRTLVLLGARVTVVARNPV